MIDHVVFFSYNGDNWCEVQQIAVRLEDEWGVKVWLDRWRLIPGEQWVPGLEQGIRESSACAVFVGKENQGTWQRPEVQAALRRNAQDPIFRVIPVLLPGADPPDPTDFLAGFTRVDFRGGLDDGQALYSLTCGVTGTSPGRVTPVASRTGDDASRAATPQPKANPHDLIAPGAAIPADSRFYIVRRFDSEILDALRRQNAMVSIVGPRQTGKTSLILSVLGAIRREGNLRPVFVDFDRLTQPAFQTMDTIWRAIAERCAYLLDLPDKTLGGWDRNSAYDTNFEQFLTRYAFATDQRPILLCFDRVDKMFDTKISTNFFGIVRSFQNNGDGHEALKRVRWLLATSSEPAMFIPDLRQSPFTIDPVIRLPMFEANEVIEFAHRFGLDLDPTRVEQIMRYTGGRPSLVHILLYHLAYKPDSHAKLFDARSSGGGVFENHLRLYVIQFGEEKKLAKVMKNVLACKNVEGKLASRLEMAGLIRRVDGKFVPLCGLYEDYFKMLFGVIK